MFFDGWLADLDYGYWCLNDYYQVIKVFFEKKKDSSALHPAVKINIVDFSAINAARLDVDLCRFYTKYCFLLAP